MAVGNQSTTPSKEALSEAVSTQGTNPQAQVQERQPKPVSKVDGFDIEMAPATTADNVSVVAKLVDIVNDAYLLVEGDLFQGGYQRTNAAEITDLIRKGHMVLIYSQAASPAEREVAGCVRVYTINARLGNFTMLALDPKHHGSGLGRALVLFAEEQCRALGCTAMQLELLMPTYMEHAGKTRSQAWYQRLGYSVVKLGNFQDEYPAIAAQLAGPCEYRIFEKALV